MTGLFRAKLAWLVILALGLLYAPPAFAEDFDTPLVSGPGGGIDRDRCAPGSLLVGLAYQGNKNINVVSAQCQRFVDGHATGPVSRLRNWGVEAEATGYVFRREGPTFSELTCAGDTAVEAINVGMSGKGVNLVHDFRFSCRNPLAHEYQFSATSYLSGGDTTYSREVGCGPGAMAVGIVVRHGSLIDGLGLICERAAAPVVAPPPLRNPTAGNAPIDTRKGTTRDPNAPTIAQRARFEGGWDTVTSSNGHFRIDLRLDGGGKSHLPSFPIKVTGQFINTDGSDEYDGVLTGTIKPNSLVLEYKYTQTNGATGTGVFTLSADGASITGDGKTSDGQAFGWNGTRSN